MPICLITGYASSWCMTRGDGFKNEIFKTHPNGLLGGLIHLDEVAKAQIGRNMKKIGL